jgi:hypothetical protein
MTVQTECQFHFVDELIITSPHLPPLCLTHTTRPLSVHSTQTEVRGPAQRFDVLDSNRRGSPVQHRHAGSARCSGVVREQHFRCRGQCSVCMSLTARNTRAANCWNLAFFNYLSLRTMFLIVLNRCSGLFPWQPLLVAWQRGVHRYFEPTRSDTQTLSLFLLWIDIRNEFKPSIVENPPHSTAVRCVVHRDVRHDDEAVPRRTCQWRLPTVASLYSSKRSVRKILQCGERSVLRSDLSCDEER